MMFTRIKHSLRFRLTHLGQRCSEHHLHERLRACGLGHARKIFTYTTPGELAALFRIAEFLPKNAVVIEVGSFLGASTCFLAAAISRIGGSLYCIDTWNNDAMGPESPRDTWLEFQNNLEPAWSMINVIRRPTQELTPGDLPVHVDFAFIDADHAYDAVKRDFQLVETPLGTRGIIAFHDVGSHKGVTRFVGELIATCEWQILGCEGSLVWLRRV